MSVSVQTDAAGDTATAGAALVEDKAGCLQVAGRMTFDTASALLRDGIAAANMQTSTQAPVFDLQAVEAVDSSALAVLFGWQRNLQAQGKPIKVLNPPPSMISLAEVYGVADLLPLN